MAHPRTAPAGADKREAITHVAPGSKIVGVISGKTEILIDGELEGELDLSSRATVGPKGRVFGNITARSIEIAGQVVGNVNGLERVELTATGSVEGNLAAPTLVIADGAFFKGEVEMTAPADGAGAAKGKGAPPAKETDKSPLPGKKAPHEDRNPKRT